MNHLTLATTLVALIGTPAWATSPSCLESEDVGERCRSPIADGLYAVADLDEDGIDDPVIFGWSEPREAFDDSDSGIDWFGETSIRWMGGTKYGVDKADAEIGVWYEYRWYDGGDDQMYYLVEDVDGDGHIDIVVSEKAWLGDGRGSFRHVQYTVGLPHNWQTGRLTDLDGDGRRDMASVFC